MPSRPGMVGDFLDPESVYSKGITPVEAVLMRILGTLAVGIVALLASLAHAELPVVKEARVSWQGCDYSIKVRQDMVPNDPYYPKPFYRISVQSEVVSSGTCSLTPRTVELETSKVEPQIAIAANAEGLVAAYSFGETYPVDAGSWIRIRVHRLEPSTLDSVRVAGLQVLKQTAGGEVRPGVAHLQELTLYPGYLVVHGTLNGSMITEDPAPIPYPFPPVQGSRLVAIYPDFFGSTQHSPQLVTF